VVRAAAAPEMAAAPAGDAGRGREFDGGRERVAPEPSAHFAAAIFFMIASGSLASSLTQSLQQKRTSVLP